MFFDPVFKGQNEIKPCKEQGPPALPWIQPLGLMSIGQVLMFCENEEGMLGPFQPMPLGQFGQELMNPYIIISLWCS